MLNRKSKPRRLSLQPLESRCVLAASMGWDGAGLGSAKLTYHIANAPDSLSQSEVNSAIETALAAWSSVADITFVPTSQPGLLDSIDISFANLDGAGGTLAQAYFPDDVNPARIAGDVEFDLAETWEIGNSLGNRAVDLVWVAVHEIGHSLGLDHLNVSGSVLEAFVSPNQQFSQLDDSDVAAIRRLYAAAEPTVPAPAATPIVPIDNDLSDSTNSGKPDIGDPDSAGPDNGSTDTGSTDTGLTDTGSTDTDKTDTDKTDTGGTDTETTDTGEREWRPFWRRHGGRFFGGRGFFGWGGFFSGRGYW